MNTLAENRRAKFDYEILETLETGIELLGLEVKSAKAGRLNLSGSYGILKQKQVWLINSQIPPYQPNNTPDGYDPSRSRRLLLHKDEINKLSGRMKEKSLSLIPLRAYLKKGFIKIELAIARSRKKSDKREVLKKRSIEREIRNITAK